MLFAKKETAKKNTGDFPILYDENGKHRFAYLDSACQSLRPRQVMEAVQAYYSKSQACGGRSMHQLGSVATGMVENARATAAKFLNATRPEEIIWTRNTTEGINLVAHSLGLKTGETVLIGDKEHNSNLIPWQRLVRTQGIKLKILASLPDNQFDLTGFENAIQGVRLVSISGMSNLDGVRAQIAEIVKIAHTHGALVLVDGAQSVPHTRTDVRKLDLDFLAFSGHKMLGPSGTGVLYGKYALLEKLEPFLVGGDTVANSTYDDCEFLPPPEKFEAGLQDYAGINGLSAAMQYLMDFGFDKIEKIETELNERISIGISELPGSHIIGPSDPKLRNGIVSFYFDGIDSHRIALMLDQMAGVMVRSGMHCAHSWFNAHKLAGCVRASTYLYNTVEDADLLIGSLQKIRKVL